MPIIKATFRKCILSTSFKTIAEIKKTAHIKIPPLKSLKKEDFSDL